MSVKMSSYRIILHMTKLRELSDKPDKSNVRSFIIVSFYNLNYICKLNFIKLLFFSSIQTSLIKFVSKQIEKL